MNGDSANHVQDNVEDLKAVFEKSIEFQLQKTNSADSIKRSQVYISAIIALKKINTQNSNLSTEAKEKRLSIMESVIETLEKKSLATDISDESIIVETHNKTSTRNTRVGTVLKCFIAFTVLSVISSIYVKRLLNKDDIQDDVRLKLPHEVMYNGDLSPVLVVRGLGKADIVNGKPTIMYTASSDRDDKLEALDIILRNKKLVNYMQSIERPVVLTFDIQKLTDAHINLDILIRGLGEAVRKNFKISDKDTAKFFIVANLNNLTVDRKNILVRFMMKSNPGALEENVKLLIKGLSFDTL